MKKFLSLTLLLGVGMTIVGCNAGETPVEEVKTVNTAPQTTPPGASGTKVPSGVPGNAIPPPPTSAGG